MAALWERSAGRNSLPEQEFRESIRSAQQAGIPTIDISHWRTIADDTFAPLDNPYNNYQYSDTFNKVQGNHSWKAGIEVIRNAMDMSFEANSRGIIRFRPLYTTQGPGIAGNEFNTWGDFLTGPSRAPL